jgi:nicotinate-nucleotide pyrophosphorylase (carboxylating)
MPLSPHTIKTAVEHALSEDLGHGFDITSVLTIPTDTQTTVYLRAREDGILAGLDVALTAFR